MHAGTEWRLCSLEHFFSFLGQNLRIWPVLHWASQLIACHSKKCYRDVYVLLLWVCWRKNLSLATCTGIQETGVKPVNTCQNNILLDNPNGQMCWLCTLSSVILLFTFQFLFFFFRSSESSPQWWPQQFCNAMPRLLLIMWFHSWWFTKRTANLKGMGVRVEQEEWHKWSSRVSAANSAFP